MTFLADVVHFKHSAIVKNSQKGTNFASTYFQRMTLNNQKICMFVPEPF